MTSLENVFTEQECTNWLKAWFALNIAKAGVEQFVDNEVQILQNNILQKLRSTLNPTTTTLCTSCGNENLSKPSRYCPQNMCDTIRDEIIKEHRYGRPSWKNTTAQQWTSNHWQIAKCFLPPDGYSDASSIMNTDFNGIISVALNCKHFDGKFSFSIATQQLPSSTCLLTKVRDFGRNLRHTSNCRVSDTDLQTVFKTLIALLCDPKTLTNDTCAQSAVCKLQKLQNASYVPTVVEMCQLLKDAIETLQTAQRCTEEAKNEIKTLKERLDILECSLDSIQKTSTTTQATKESKSALSVEEFDRRLKGYYTDNLSHLPVSALRPSYDKPTKEIFTTPDLRLLTLDKDDTKKKCISKYKDITYTDNKINRRIFLQGESGTGKSTFVAKMVLDWCNGCLLSPNTITQPTDFSDLVTLQEFKFIFLIKLGDLIGQREVDQMIKNQIIDKIYEEPYRENAYNLLLKVLTTERCLVIQDGLDQWIDITGQVALPLMAVYGNMCSVLITTRPLKMDDERIKDSQIDILLQLEGVKDPDILCKRIFSSLTKNKPNMCFMDFKKFVVESNLSGLLSLPNFLSLIVSSWVDGTRSLCEVHSILLDSMFKEAPNKFEYFNEPPVRCYTKTSYLKPHIECLTYLSKTAFFFLFCFTKENALCFSDIELWKQLTQKHMSTALKTGVLTKRKGSCLTNKLSTCSFIFKRIQEFLAAYHIAQNMNVIDDVCSEYIARYGNLEISHVFHCLCGLNIEAANKLSVVMDKHSSAPCPMSLQRVIFSGYSEALANKQDNSNICLKLSHIYFVDTLETDDNALDFILKINTCNIRSVYFNGHTRLSDFYKILVSSAPCLQHLDIHVESPDGTIHVLDLSSCRNLETINISGQVNLLPNALRELKILKTLSLHCYCDGLDLASCNSLVSIMINGHITLASKTLCELTKLQRVSLYGQCELLDLSSCHNLDDVLIRGLVTLVLNFPSGFQKLKCLALLCHCDKLDLSLCHSLQKLTIEPNVTLMPNTLRGLKKLQYLNICCNYDGLELSSCHDIEEVSIRGQVTLLPNVFFKHKNMRKITLLCKCVKLDLAGCQNLQEIYIKGQVNLLSTGLREFEKLKKLKLVCKCDALDLTSCCNLKTLDLGEQVTLLPNTLRACQKLKHFQMKGVCSLLDLSSCHSLVTIVIRGAVTLLPNSLTEHKRLTSLTLHCICKGLDLSSCHNLKTIDISGSVTLLPNSVLQLVNLKHLTLHCKCDGLDLSYCVSLESVYLSEQVTFLQKSLRDLKRLRTLTIRSKCDCLDLSICPDLETVMVSGLATMVPDALTKLTKLKRLSLWCNCSGLNLSSCQSLETIDLRNHVTLMPNKVIGLNKLTSVKILCDCVDLDFAGLDNLQEIVINGQATLLPNTLNNLQKLKCLTLFGTLNKTDIQKWFPANKIDHTELNNISLPPSITYITLIDVCCSSLWLRHLFRTLSSINHHVNCTLNQCCITTCEDNIHNRSEALGETSVDLLRPRDKSGVSLTCVGDTEGLFDALYGTGLVCLNVVEINHPIRLSETLPNLTQLKFLRLASREYIDIKLKLPNSYCKLCLVYNSLSASSLRHLLKQLSTVNYPVECQLLLGYEEPLDEYITIKKEVIASKHVDVIEFNIMNMKKFGLNDISENVEMEFCRKICFLTNHMINVRLRYHCRQKWKTDCSVN